MPVTVFDRLPLPSFTSYLAVSAALISMSAYYAVSVTNDPNWKATHSQYFQMSYLDETPRPKWPDKLFSFDLTDTNKTSSISSRASDVFTFLLQDPICTWTLINTAYCSLAILGAIIQKVVFGKLRISEIQHLKDKFWNFIFYKFIFIFGVINVQYMEEVLLWCSWFSLLGFLGILAQLSKDRFEYLSFSPTTPGRSHVKLLILLGSIQLIASSMMIFSVWVGFHAGLNIFAFMAAECLHLWLRTLLVLFRYGLHLYEVRAAQHSSEPPLSSFFGSVGNPSLWDKRAPFTYQVELILELLALVCDLCHHMHMLIWSNIFLSMASLVICMQLRYLFHAIQTRLRKHRNYLWVLQHMDRSYPMATSQEIAENSDNCAICWERMESARKLPCLHLFHNSCLSQWLQQDTTCPTCRATLPVWEPPAEGGRIQRRHRPRAARLIRRVTLNENDDGGGVNVIAADNETNEVVQRPQLNHFFHFDGSRYFSWLPSFSVEFTQMRSENGPTTSQVDGMARQVQQLFPHYPLTLISQDLQITRSAELTVENILEGHLVLPNHFIHVEDRMPEEVLPLGSGTDTGVTEQQSEQNANFTIMESPPNYNAYSFEPIPEGEPVAVGGRFSKSSAEREKMLEKRKENIMANALLKYLDKESRKLQSEANSDGGTSTQSAQDRPSTSRQGS